ncbi:unnamed protein product, partial [Allacma fusca]
EHPRTVTGSFRVLLNIDLRKEAITFNVDFSAIHLYGTNVSNPEDENNFLRKGASEIMGEAEV